MKTDSRESARSRAAAAIEIARRRTIAYPTPALRIVALTRSLRNSLTHYFESALQYVVQSKSFAFLYKDVGQKLVHVFTAASLLMLVGLLAWETSGNQRLTIEEQRFYDAWFLLALLIEVVMRGIRLEFLYSFAWQTTRLPQNLGDDDLRRLTLLKVMQFYFDILLVVALMLFVFAIREIDPIGAAMFRLVRLIALLRLFDIAIMRDLTAVILSAFESVALVMVALGMHVFVYGVVGTVWFGNEFPQYFGTLQTTINSLLYPLINKGDAPFAKEVCRLDVNGDFVRILYFASFLWIGGAVLLGLLLRLVKEKLDLLNKGKAHHSRNG